MSEMILVIEDEGDLATTLVYNLEQAGWSAQAVHSADEGLLAATELVPDAILLDLMLPDMSGIEVCRRLRADERTAAVPILMLTAKGEEIDRVVGFEVGADDYVTKPFSVREVILRVRALLRRSGTTAEVPGAPQETVEIAGLRLDPAAYRVWVEGAEVELTALEFRLAMTLMERRGRVQTRSTLLADVWGYSAEVTTRTVDTHIKRLRQKLGSAGELIETVRGVGYRFRQPQT